MELLKKWTRISLIKRILVGMLLGIILGMALPKFTVIGILGTLFVGALKALAPLLVFFIVIHALAQRQKGGSTNMGSVIVLYLVGTFLAALCAVPAFAEATPGEAANTAATKITAKNASTNEGAGFAKSIADYYTANPTVPVTKQNANAAATVINAHADMAIANGTFDKDTIKKVSPSTGSVTNAVAVQTIEKSQISNLSLTKKDDNTLVLSATWTGTQPSAGANIAVYGMDTSAAYQIVFVDDAGNRTTIDSVSKVADGVVVFWVPHFSTYEIVKVSAVADTAPAAAASATTTVDAAAVDAQFYTCKACGYHNWTGTVGGYKCDHCGHIEAKDLSSYPNVKGTATLPTATSAAASNNIIKATGADMSMVVLAVLALAAALVAGFACIVRKQGLGK